MTIKQELKRLDRLIWPIEYAAMRAGKYDREVEEQLVKARTHVLIATRILEHIQNSENNI